jgi:hypothetical protein
MFYFPTFSHKVQDLLMRVVLSFPFEVSCELDLLLMVCKIFELALDIILTSYNFLSECDLDKAAGRPGKSTRDGPSGRLRAELSYR